MVQRILVEKKKGFDVEAQSILKDLKQNLNLKSIHELRLVNCYDIESDTLSEEALDRVKRTVLSEPNVDCVYDEHLPAEPSDYIFRVALLPGQYDQRKDSAQQCMELVTLQAKVEMETSKIYILTGDIDESLLAKVKNYLINPVESEEVALEKPAALKKTFKVPDPVATVEDFISWTPSELSEYGRLQGFAMSADDLNFIQAYFKNEEKRNPTVTELKVLDTYWSDHCRHTTFMSELESIEFEKNDLLEKAFKNYEGMRNQVYPQGNRPMTLMDLATINMKYLRMQGGLDDLDVSDEINACSLKIKVNCDGELKPWLLMFKNETHNHPTEIEPYGGAATCLGGAIRDPLSGRSYVYQSMRVTGAADPRRPIEETLEGKLPQRVITQKAAAGFSSYGNQIGLATGIVSEVYDEGFLAKRMEVGAVIAAAPAEQVVREKPALGDAIVLLGGRTGRDGVGGATGSSKAHDEESIVECGAEVQKGNPPEERKIQRLFRNPDAAKLIKKCNDFGAGGVSVAIGELADSLDIHLDEVPKKYAGLDGTEIAISESQERMAVVLSPENVESFLKMADAENLEATVVAKVTDTGRMRMFWRDQIIVDLSRSFVDSNGAKTKASVKVKAPDVASFFKVDAHPCLEDILSDINVASQKGLVERFDSTIGSGTVLMPFGGAYESTPIQSMVAKIPVLQGETDTVSMMSYGYDPEISKLSPFHGGMYAVVSSVAKIVATGGDYKKIRLSLQEYFEKLGQDPEKWGKPFSALLGASYAQTAFATAAIGGKDSMSGTFKDLSVPPTLISFAVCHGDAHHVISPELKMPHGNLYAYIPEKNHHGDLNFEKLKEAYEAIHQAILSGDIVSAYAIEKGGIARALTQMAMGNRIGLSFESLPPHILFAPHYGGIVFEMKSGKLWAKSSFEGMIKVGRTLAQPEIKHAYEWKSYSLESLQKSWEAPLASIFPIAHHSDGKVLKHRYTNRSSHRPSIQMAQPKVFIPVFPGTNCEYDSARAFERVGAKVESLVFRNQSPQAIRESLAAMVKAIKSSQIIMLPGGFSAGDEPEGSGKFIASALRNPEVAEAIMEHLHKKDGLMLGICNGFQALVKLGLLPYGEMRALDDQSPTLTFNGINRHVARMGKVRVASVMSPWMSECMIDDVYQTAFSHGEGRFYAPSHVVEELVKKGQVATQYVNEDHEPTMCGYHNINGSVDAIEGISSADGRIFGKMGHVERVGKHLYKNIIGEKDMQIFKAGVKYFK